MAFDVAHGDSQTVMRQGNEVEIIAAGFIGRIGRPRNIETGDSGRWPIKLLLYLPRQTQLNFALLDIQSLADVLYYSDEVRNVAGLVHDGGDGFLNGIGLPRFSSI